MSSKSIVHGDVKMLLAFAKTIDISTITDQEKSEILTFRTLVFGEGCTWNDPNEAQKLAIQHGALHVRAWSGNGLKAANRYNLAHEEARNQAQQFADNLIMSMPLEVLEGHSGEEPEDSHPLIQDAWNRMNAFEGALFDQKYEYKLYDYIDQLNGIE